MAVKLHHGDLFSGIGGFTIAAGWAGFRTVFFSEVESYCCGLLAERWPGIPNLGDIRTADFSPYRNQIGVLSGGFPCQPFSLAGRRCGKADDRDLWPAMLHAVAEVRPVWVICENVPGIISLGQLDRVCLDLESLGYATQPFSVPANSVGAMHRRQRVFIVANSDRAGLEEFESRQSGERQTLIGSSGSYGFRLTQPPLCRRADGIQNRSYRLKALGNACVPQQAYPFFAAIAQVESANETAPTMPA